MVIRQRGVMLDFSDRGQASFGALPARERDGSVQGNDRARVHLIKQVVLLRDILPVGGVVGRRESVLSRDAGLQMIGRKLIAFGVDARG
jgi:hypothetical protein